MRMCDLNSRLAHTCGIFMLSHNVGHAGGEGGRVSERVVRIRTQARARTLRSHTRAHVHVHVHMHRTGRSSAETVMYEVSFYDTFTSAWAMCRRGMTKRREAAF